MWYEEAKALADVVGSSEEKPHTTRHQRHRGNMPAESTAEYYKRAFAIPFIDELLQHLRDWFSEENRAIVSIFSIIPALIISSVDPQGQTEHMKPWEADLPSPMSLPNKLQRLKLYWVEKREAGATIPDNLKSSIAHADEDVFPNIRVLLILGCIMPITSAEAERSFSLFRRLKTHLRSRMSEGRLASLGLMAMHYVKILVLWSQ